MSGVLAIAGGVGTLIMERAPEDSATLPSTEVALTPSSLARARLAPLHTAQKPAILREAPLTLSPSETSGRDGQAEDGFEITTPFPSLIGFSFSGSDPLPDNEEMLTRFAAIKKEYSFLKDKKAKDASEVLSVVNFILGQSKAYLNSLNKTAFALIRTKHAESRSRFKREDLDNAYFSKVLELYKHIDFAIDQGKSVFSELKAQLLIDPSQILTKGFYEYLMERVELAEALISFVKDVRVLCDPTLSGINCEAEGDTSASEHVRKLIALQASNKELIKEIVTDITSIVSFVVDSTAIPRTKITEDLDQIAVFVDSASNSRKTLKNYQKSLLVIRDLISWHTNVITLMNKAALEEGVDSSFLSKAVFSCYKKWHEATIAKSEEMSSKLTHKKVMILTSSTCCFWWC